MPVVFLQLAHHFHCPSDDVGCDTRCLAGHNAIVDVSAAITCPGNAGWMLLAASHVMIPSLHPSLLSPPPQRGAFPMGSGRSKCWGTWRGRGRHTLNMRQNNSAKPSVRANKPPSILCGLGTVLRYLSKTQSCAVPFLLHGLPFSGKWHTL